MTEKRRKGLRRNIYLLFFAKALMTMSVLNAVVVLFYVHRGVSLSEVFYLSIVWSITALVVEIPSSYMADRWGRKQTLLIGGAFLLIYFTSLFFAHGFWQFAFGIMLLSTWFAMFSGTDEAIVYDSKKELGEEHLTLQSLGLLQSAPRFFKILAPIIGAVIAKDLLEVQYLTIVAIDMIGALIACVLLLFLVEPDHRMDVQKQEAGAIIDAWKHIFDNPVLLRMIANKFVIFVAIFIIWRYHQQIFVDFGVSIVAVGFAWALLFQLPSFLTTIHIQKLWPSLSVQSRIRRLNVLCLFGLIICLVFIALGWWHVVLVCFAFTAYVQFIVNPLFSELFHSFSHSYNRATFISLSNAVKSIIDIPMLFLTGLLVSYHVLSPFFIALVLVFVALVFLRLPHTLSPRV